VELAAPGSATWAFEKVGTEWEAKTTTPISAEDGEKLEKLIEVIIEHDDVQNIYTNAK